MDEIRSNRNPSPIPYPEVNKVLNVLLPDVQEILGNQFIGMYLYGSLAYGGFDRDSDVDFVVVTREDLPEALFSALQAMHTRIATLDSWCATQLEGSYIPRRALRLYDPLRALHLHIDRGRDGRLHRMVIEDARLSRAWWGGWVLLRAVLRESGIALAGPAPETFIAPVSPDDLRQATLAILQGWAAPLLEQPAELANCGYQSYTILTLCRMLYTLEYGAIASKSVAARWAQERLGQPWTALIERAWVGRHNPQVKAREEDVNGTLDFIRFTLEHN
jgi:predicted nucleotidyltransferase